MIREFTTKQELNSFHQPQIFTAIGLFLGASAASAAATGVIALTTVLSTGFAIFNARQTASTQSAIAKQNAATAAGNAELSRNNAELERINTRAMERRIRERGKKEIGAARALLGKAGVETTTGTPLLVLSDIAADIELDVISNRYSGSLTGARRAAEEAGFKQQEIQADLAGSLARQRGTAKTGAALVSGIERFATIAKET